jgi:hypothetical protein
MNERNANADDEFLAKRAKEVFDRSVEGLDAETRSRLNRARHEALSIVETGDPYGRWLRRSQRVLPVAGVTAAAMIAVVIWTGRPPVDDLTPPATASDFEILLAEDSFEMLEELEFYSWMELQAELGEDADTNDNVG